MKKAESMMPHPESPKAIADRLGLSIDLSRYLSPAIVGKFGKRHYYAHGGGFGKYEATAVLMRLERMRAAISATLSTKETKL